MQRCKSTVLVSVVCLSLLGATGHLHAQAKLIDNFDDGNDEGWTHIDLLAILGVGSSDFDASSGSYVVSTDGEVPELPPGIPCSGGVAGRAASPADTSRYSNGTAKATVRFDNAISSGGLLMRADPSQLNAYNFAANNSEDRIYIDLIENGIGLTGGLASQEFDLAPSQDYIIEGRAVGPHLSMKIWEAGADEPDEPQLSVFDTTYETGMLGVLSYYCTPDYGDSLSTTFDDIYFLPGNSDFGTDGPMGIPEPSSLFLTVFALLGAAVLLRRRTA
jgi:hypothetical protein